MDTTPRSSNPEPDRPDGAPRWFLLSVVLFLVLGALWIMWTIFGGGRAL